MLAWLKLASSGRCKLPDVVVNPALLNPSLLYAEMLSGTAAV